ncbi:MAG: hypothetical protein ACEPOZ_11735 [Marinifilaceae bacterium]
MKYLKYIILLSLPLFFTACDDSSDAIEGDGVAAIRVSPTQIYSLDGNIDSKVTIEGMEVASLTTSLGIDIPLSSGTGTLTVNKSILKFKEGSATVDFIGTMENGMVFRKPVTYSYNESVTASGPETVMRNEKDAKIGFSIDKNSTPATGIRVFLGINSGTPVEIGQNWKTTTDTIILKGVNYQNDDTLKYEIVATSPNGTSSCKFETVVEACVCNGLAEFTLNNEHKAFDLVKGELVEGSEAVKTDVENEDIILQASEGKAGFTSATSAQFVVATEEAYKSGDFNAIKELYAEGTKVSTVEEVKDGDVFVYHVTRTVDDKEVEVYGIMKAVTVYESFNGNVEKIGILFEYKFLE